MAKYDLPPLDFLRECFSVDPEEGVVRWRERPRNHFSDLSSFSRWSRLFPGKGGCLEPAGYLIFGVSYHGKALRLKAHRVAFALYTGRQEFRKIDHKNQIRTDNRRENLREASSAQNLWNRSGWGKSGLPKGVSRNGSRFQATTRVNGGKTVYLGTFDTPAEAHQAYCDFVKPLHGEFFNPGAVFDITSIFG